MSNKIRLAVDFDRTIALSQKPTIGPVVPGAVEGLTKLHQLGYHILIWSARNNKQDLGELDRVRGLKDMKDYLDKNNIPYDDIDYGHTGKPIVDVFVDDHALGVPLINVQGQTVVDWQSVVRMIRLLAVSQRL